MENWGKSLPLSPYLVGATHWRDPPDYSFVDFLFDVLTSQCFDEPFLWFHGNIFFTVYQPIRKDEIATSENVKNFMDKFSLHVIQYKDWY